MKELIEKVRQWGLDRGIVYTGAEGQDKRAMMEAQARYTLKETAELLDAYADQDIDKINDAIGDILVTLIVGASSDWDIFDGFSRLLERSVFGAPDADFYSSYMDLIDATRRLFRDMEGGYLTYYNYIHICAYLNSIAVSDCRQSSLKDCLELAYNEIKDRTGKVINGQFIKDK